MEKGSRFYRRCDLARVSLRISFLITTYFLTWVDQFRPVVRRVQGVLLEKLELVII